MTRKYYGSLRDTHGRTLEDLNKHIEQSKEPARDAETPARGDPMSRAYYDPLRHDVTLTLADLNAHIERNVALELSDAVQGPQAPHRPERMPVRSVTWTTEGGLDAHQASAVDMIRAHNEQREITEANRELRRQPETRERTEASIEKDAREPARETANDKAPEQQLNLEIKPTIDRGDF